jgi:DNA repair photolyase
MDNTDRTTMNGKPVIRVPVKTVLNFQSGFEKKLLCDGITLAMGDACAYSCEYCYVPQMMVKLDRVAKVLAERGLQHHEAVILREAALDVLLSQILNKDGRRKFGDHDTRTLYTSPLDDVAANMDLVRATVQAVLLILTHTSWHVRILSKSPLITKLAGDLCTLAERHRSRDGVGEDEVRRRVVFGLSTGTLYDELSAVIETGTPLVSKRINALHILQDNGFRTFAMVCPSMPRDNPSEYLTEALNASARLRYHKCEHVWAEVINVRGESFTRTVSALRGAGFHRIAERVDMVSSDAVEWELYNRETFLAHAKVCENFGAGKLRYLTYVKDATRGWWEKHIAKGAVIL